MDKKEAEHLGIASYVIGVLSIVFGILQPAFGFGFGVAGLILSKKSQSGLSKKAKKLNLIGIAVSIIVILLSVVVGFYVAKLGLLNPIA